MALAIMRNFDVLGKPAKTQRPTGFMVAEDDCAACSTAYSKQSGVISNPAMLGGAMTYEDVQKALHSNCPEHCTRKSKSHSGTPNPFGGFEGTDDDDYGTVGDDEDVVDEDIFDDDGTPCHTVKSGDMCYDLVAYTIRKLLTNPDFYKGLTRKSTDLEVQARLHRDRPGICPRPCVDGEEDGSTAKSLKSEDASGAEAGADGKSGEGGDGGEGEGGEGGESEGEDAAAEANAEGECWTATKDTDCYDTVIWVLSQGVFKHPKWFQGLNQASSMEEVQQFLHENPDKGPQVRCPKPCEQKCRTAEEGEPCHGGVTWAMEVGIKNHSDWFVGLTPDSSFEEVQLHFHNNRNATVYCPLPCGACHTAAQGERCYSAVVWVLQEGLKKNPDSYPGLTEFSSFQEIQEYLHRNKSEKEAGCGKPCAVARAEE